MYIGVTLLHWPEPAVWRMTPFKLLSLFRIHKEFNSDRFKTDDSTDDLDAVLGG